MSDPAGRPGRIAAMRHGVKFLHTLSSCGLVGGLLAYMLVLWKAPQANAIQFADMRDIVSLVCRFVIVPSLGLSLVTGLLAMLAHRPYQDKRWAWAKALLGLSMFESTLALTQAKAVEAADFAAQLAQTPSDATAALLAQAIGSEWTALWAILALGAAQTALGVWRPQLKWKTRITETGATRI